MAYITGTVTDPNPGPTLYALIAPALTTAGYTLVDTVVISTHTHKIWKSAAANNSQNLDWYLDVAYTTAGAGNLWLVPFEFYDPATDLGYRGPNGNTSNTTFETTYYSRLGGTGNALETTWVGANQTNISISLTISSFGYWLSVTGDRIICIGSNNAVNPLYAGMYTPDPLYAAKVGAALFPLISCITGPNATGGAQLCASSTSTGSAGLTRVPTHTGLQGPNGWGGHVVLYAEHSHIDMGLSPIPGTALVYPPVVVGVGIYAGTYLNDRCRFGTLTDMAIMNAAGTVTRGDTVTISGVTWILSSFSNGAALLFKAI